MKLVSEYSQRYNYDDERLACWVWSLRKVVTEYFLANNYTSIANYCLNVPYSLGVYLINNL